MKLEALTEKLPGIYRAIGPIPIGGPMCMNVAMHIFRANDAVVLVDPCILPESDLKMIEDLGGPTHIILTCGNHVRDADFYRVRYQAPILANRALMSKIETGVDTFFNGGDELPGGVLAIDMLGMSPGETVLLHSVGAGALVVGDAIFNYQPGDFSIPLKMASVLGMVPNGLSPMPSFIMEDKKKAADSCRKLVDYDFDAIFVSHGSPVLSGAKTEWASVVQGL